MIKTIATLATVALAMAMTTGAVAQPPAKSSPVAGRWQGTVKSGAETLRLVVRLEEPSPGRWSCFVNFIERTPLAYRCTAIQVKGDRVLLSVADVAAQFEGVVADRGQALSGTYASPTAGTQAIRLARATDATAWVIDSAPHKQSFHTASDGTRLEVLDYGGQGPALIFVPGLGAGAHVFDRFAPRFTDTHHVLAVSRRGYGESDRPAATAEAYRSRRLGDDLVQVMDALKIERAVLAGWSIGGVELASVATRLPSRAAGVVYLDAAYAYTFYAPGNRQSDFNVDIALNDLTQRIVAARTMEPAEGAKAMDEILRVAIPDLAYDVAVNRERFAEAAAMPTPVPQPGPPSQPFPTPQLPRATISSETAVGEAITRNVERLGVVQVPVLAIFADSKPLAAPNKLLAVSFERFMLDRPALRARFEAAHPHAKIVVLKNARHDVFASNPDEVTTEMRTFMSGLSR